MQSAKPQTDNDRLTVAVALAAMLERLERSGTAPDAEQYRTVVRRLADALVSAPKDEGLTRLLAASPAAAELYENQQYEHAGLCLHALDSALGAEMAARKAIEKARRGATA